MSYVMKTIPPAVMPVDAAKVVIGAFRNADDGHDNKCRAAAAVDLLTYAVKFYVGTPNVIGSVAPLADAVAADAIEALVEGESASGFGAAAIPPWLIPTILALLFKLLG